MQIVNENRDTLDDSIKSKIMNMDIRKCRGLFASFKPISIALDRIQKYSCSITETLMHGKN